MSNQQMEHPEGHSDWTSTPASGGSSHNDSAANTGAPRPAPRTKGAPGEYAHASPLGGSLEEDPSVNTIGEGTVWSRERDLRIYSTALVAHTVMGVTLGWMWHLSGAGVSDSAWGYVLRWSCMAWTAAACTLVCVWSSARRELKRERRLTAKVYAAEFGLSSEDNALFMETVGKVS